MLVLCLFAFLGLANAQTTGVVNANPDPIDLGYRPLGAWMRPLEVQLTATGASQAITALEADKDFFVIDAQIPGTVSGNVPYKFTVTHGEGNPGEINGNVVVTTNSRKAYIFDIQAVAYSPIAADVAETAPTITLPFTATVGENIYDNYLLPGTAPDGKDVIYKMNVTEDILFNANVEGANGKVALYTEDFNGEPGPGADNNYTGAAVGEATGGPFEAEVGVSTTTSGYVPAYYLYNYAMSQQLYLADELIAAGANAGNITSLGFYSNSTYGYQLKNTLTEHGSVARGCCRMNEEGYLTHIEELTKIEKTAEGARYTQDDGASWTEISTDTLVSMNMWGFQPEIFEKLDAAVERFFREEMEKNPLKSECFIPIEVGRMVREKEASVKVLSSEDKWFGVTYKEDKPFVMESIQKLKDQGVYPEKLWS